MLHFRNPQIEKLRLPETNSFDCLGQIQIGPNFRFESVGRDTEESEFLDSVDFGAVALSVETVEVVCLQAQTSTLSGFKSARFYAYPCIDRLLAYLSRLMTVERLIDYFCFYEILID